MKAILINSVLYMYRMKGLSFFNHMHVLQALYITMFLLFSIRHNKPRKFLSNFRGSLHRGFRFFVSLSALLQLQAAPEATGDAAPEGSEQAVAPVDDTDVAMVVDGSDDVARHVLGLEHHRIVEVARQQGGIDESWTDIREVNIQVACVSLLFQCLQINVLQGFGGRIRGCWAEALGAGYRVNGGNMSAAL